MGIGREFIELTEKLGYVFHDIKYLETALTHTSYSYEAKSKGQRAVSNEELEFLGDAVLGYQRSQLAGDLLAAGEDHDTAGDLVQTVDGGDIVVFAGIVVVFAQPAGHALYAAVIFREIVDGFAADHQMGIFIEDDGLFHSVLLIKKQTRKARLLLLLYLRRPR